MNSGQETSLNAKTYNYLLGKKYFSSFLWISKERLILTALQKIECTAVWLMSSEKCNDHLRSRNKQLFRFLGLKEIKKLNYLTQMLVPTNWTELVYRNDDFRYTRSLIIMSRLRHLHWQLPPVLKAVWHLTATSVLTFGLGMCGNPSPSLYRANYTMIALIKTVPSERWLDWST